MQQSQGAFQKPSAKTCLLRPMPEVKSVDVSSQQSAQSKTIKLGIFATHPVQYHVPIWRALSQDQSLQVSVHYFSDHGVTEKLDKDFGQSFRWDGDLLSGYKSEFLSKLSLDLVNKGLIPNAKSSLSHSKFDCVLLHGYMPAFSRQLIRYKKRNNYRIILRGEFSDLNHKKDFRGIAREFYLRWFYSKVDAFCYVGKDAKAHLQKRGIDERKLFFSPYSVDSESFERQASVKCREERRRALGIRKDQVVALFTSPIRLQSSPTR